MQFGYYDTMIFSDGLILNKFRTSPQCKLIQSDCPDIMYVCYEDDTCLLIIDRMCIPNKYMYS